MKFGSTSTALAMVVWMMCVTVSATGTTPQMLVPVGHTAGIEAYAQGVVVVKLIEGDTPAREAGLQSGDLIVKCNGQAVSSTEEFQEILQTGTTTQLELSRGTTETMVTVEPTVNDQGTYSIGAWVRDSMAGIGTITYYDPETNAFGALGHGITDGDTGQLLPLSSGTLIPSSVKLVQMGAVGVAGQLKGAFDLDDKLASVTANTESGIYGTFDQDMTFPEQALPVATASEIQVGSATILSNVNGDTVETFDIEITAIRDSATDGRNLELKITDPDLLSITGGIVQGMSGSPIVQNGKLIGAVTHVLVNDPTKGYGIFIENMLTTAETVQ